MWNVIIPVAAGLVLLAAVIIFNSFVRKKNLMREAWSGIDVQLKRRHDLIPNLVETIKGYTSHEKTLFESIAETRLESIKGGDVKKIGAAENMLSGLLKNLFAVAEAYPELKADQTFLELQKNLSNVEDQLQMARRYYNGTVREYNILTETFPSLIIALLMGYKTAEYFEVETSAEANVPDLKF